MINNYFKSALRNIKRNALFSVIDVLGLAVGAAACLLILHWVNFEKSYDKFHQDSDRIYRLRYERSSEDGQKVQFASCCPPAVDAIRGAYPEVEEIARIYPHPAVVIPEKNNVQYMEERMYFVESEFFNLFDFSFIKGDPVNGIRSANNAFISSSTASRYFGQEEAMGKTFTVDGKVDYTVTGIFKDIPLNSHLKFDVLLSYQNLLSIRPPEVLQSWGYTLFYTYLKLSPGADPVNFEKNLIQLVDIHAGELMNYYKVQIELKMQPLEDIHLTSHFMQEYEINGNRTSVNVLLIVALFIIFMAWINYINLSTARSLKRAKEVGLRKIIGASRIQLITQFFLETFTLYFLASVLALVLVNIFLSTFGRLTGVPAEVSPWISLWFWITLLVFFLFGVLLSGSYPVVALSSFHPAGVLRGDLGQAPKGTKLRKTLVAFQFVIAIVLISAALTVYRQIHYMKKQDLGFDIENIAVVDAPRIRDESFQQAMNSYKNELHKQSNILKLCVITEVPGRQILWDNGGIMRAGEDAGKGKNYQIVGVDYDFVDVFDLNILYGRNFSREFPADEKALILNETAAKWMGFSSSKEAVGQKVDYWGEIYPIIGVLEDYHQQSLKEAFEPHIYRLYPYGRPPWGLFAIKISDLNPAEAIQTIEKHYKDFFPGNPFEYYFLDDYFNQQYLSDEQFGRVIGLFTFLAVFVTCLGIFGMSSHTAIQRTREIGIRKVLGASTGGILKLFLTEFLVLISLSLIIAWPLAYWGMLRWLQSFASRMSWSVLLLILPVVIVLSVTLFSTSFNIIKAARSNPVDSIKYE
jgi:putative ABC transport system permease protein